MRRPYVRNRIYNLRWGPTYVEIPRNLFSSVTPVYQSEISLPEHRGWQVCCQLTSMLGGLMLAYWINYGFYFHHSSVQWRFPLLFQCVFAVYIIIVTAFLPDSPRWLLRHDATPDRGTLVLAKLRNLPMDHPIVQREKKEILDAIELEAKEEGTWMDLFRDNGIMGNKRFYLSLAIQFMQQMSGKRRSLNATSAFTGLE